MRSSLAASDPTPNRSTGPSGRATSAARPSTRVSPRASSAGNPRWAWTKGSGGPSTGSAPARSAESPLVVRPGGHRAEVAESKIAAAGNDQLGVHQHRQVVEPAKADVAGLPGDHQGEIQREKKAEHCNLQGREPQHKGRADHRLAHALRDREPVPVGCDDHREELMKAG